MTLPPLRVTIRPFELKGKTVLTLDTGVSPDSMEGLRLVKASRGTGWFYRAGTLVEWSTKGVTQDGGRLLVWGDLAEVPQSTPVDRWPTEGEGGREFLQALFGAWTALAAKGALPRFSVMAAVPYRTFDGWAFVFPPEELRLALDTQVPLADRLAWEPLRHPDWTGGASWAFTSAALAWSVLEGPLPWVQEEEAHLRQEVRDLRKTLKPEELPTGLDSASAQLWYDSLTDKSAPTTPLWAQWSVPLALPPREDPVRDARRKTLLDRRRQRRASGSFLRKRGTFLLSVGIGLALTLTVVGTVVWNAIKPHPSDTWSAEQVVRGYYQALHDLDSDLMARLVQYDKSQSPELEFDHNEATNLYVIRQVRIGVERVTPIVDPRRWEADGRPLLRAGQMLFGLSTFELEGKDDQWTVRYHKWTTVNEENQLPLAVGTAVTDHITLLKTDRGWRLQTLTRHRQPLP